MSEEMNPVSPRLVKVRYIRHLGWTVIFAAAAAAAGYWWTPWFYWAAGLFAVLFFWLVWLIPAQVRRMGWCETDDELLITRGKLWHSFTVVPHGPPPSLDAAAAPPATAGYSAPRSTPCRGCRVSRPHTRGAEHARHASHTAQARAPPKWCAMPSH